MSAEGYATVRPPFEPDALDPSFLRARRNAAEALVAWHREVLIEATKEQNE